MSDLTFGPSFKVKRWFTDFGELSFWWIQICIISPMRRSSYLPPGSPEGDYNLHHVRVYVRACVCECVRACVRVCVTQFSLKLLQLHIFGKSQVLMNFFALQYFWGLVNFGLLLSE